MPDIVERLRHDIQIAETDACKCYVNTMAEALDEIERLREETERLRLERDKAVSGQLTWMGIAKVAGAENKRLRFHLAELCKTLGLDVEKAIYK